jgi:hypothetical protein
MATLQDARGHRHGSLDIGEMEVVPILTRPESRAATHEPRLAAVSVSTTSGTRYIAQSRFLVWDFLLTRMVTMIECNRRWSVYLGPSERGLARVPKTNPV